MWEGPTTDAEPIVYFTFDDGPHPELTHFVLEELDRYGASGTFFCLGKNALAQPGLFERMQRSRHAVANHTHNHLNGWKSDTAAYLADVAEAARHIPSGLFRPPYGRIKRGQAATLAQRGFRVVMWSLLSADFDTELSPQRCLEAVVLRIRPGHIVVFHDSAKAAPRLRYTLPRVLAHCAEKGWKMEKLDANQLV